MRWLLDMNFLHYAILMFVVCAGRAGGGQPDDARARIGASSPALRLRP